MMWAWLRQLLGDSDGTAEKPPEAPLDPAVDLPPDDPDALEWPTLPKGAGAADLSARYAAQLEVRKKRVDEEIARTKARTDADLQDLEAFATAYRSMATGSIQRARDGADSVIKGSAAIVTLYTGILGLVFAANGTPLPARGVVAPLFLGGAVVLATAYLAFLRPRDEVVKGRSLGNDVQSRVIGRSRMLVQLTKLVTSRLSWCMRAAVMSLGVGLAFLPLPFVDVTQLPFGPEPASADQSVASTSTAPAWPPAVLKPGEDIRLAKILYAAQVRYASEQAASAEESTAPSGQDDTELVAWCVLIGAGVITVTTLLSGRRKRAAR